MSLDVTLPSEWWHLGAPIEDPQAIIAAHLATSGATSAAQERLRHGLSAVLDYTHRLGDGRRTSFALVRDVERGQVEALLSARITRVSVDFAEKYHAALVEATVPDGVEVVNQRIERATLPTGEAIVVHHFVLPLDDAGPMVPAMERCVVALFPPAPEPTMVEFLFATQNLALFPDLVDYALAVVSGDNPGVPASFELEAAS
ncbi:hypothetical protein [Protaetiibacter intestinalis]|uniref:Uncharacterized protein n=1 Tax=Protaetiibacter intestinalis TaxID=2419774 RepID=A0A387B9J9_9MICO|nr:hypothetical protein [Protaetiibacter intestinalis]AYF98521.1 hypothetical protein D7I47_09785 [Protaetiibacter intestinalis]